MPSNTRHHKAMRERGAGRKGQQAASTAMLREYLGDLATAKLIESLGGISLKIPKRPAGRVFDELLQAVGESSAAEIVRHFGGEGLYVPNNHAAALECRRAQILELAAQGMKPSQIARLLTFKARFTERGIRRMMEGLEKPTL